MANMSDYLENKIIDHVFRGQAFTTPATLYIALCTSTPSDASNGTTCFECVDASYTRQVIANTTANWAATDGATSIVSPSGGTGGTTSNNAAITWANWASTNTISAVVISDNATTSKGNLLFWGTLTANKVVSSGDSFAFNVSQLSIQIDN